MARGDICKGLPASENHIVLNDNPPKVGIGLQTKPRLTTTRPVFLQMLFLTI